MENLQTIEQFEEVKNSGKTVWYFTAGWCPDCHFIEPVMPEIEANFADYRFVKVDRDEFIDLCVAQDVYGIPSFIVTNNGEELGRFVNKDRKTKEQIEEFISNLA